MTSLATISRRARRRPAPQLTTAAATARPNRAPDAFGITQSSPSRAHPPMRPKQRFDIPRGPYRRRPTNTTTHCSPTQFPRRAEAATLSTLTAATIDPFGSITASAPLRPHQRDNDMTSNADLPGGSATCVAVPIISRRRGRRDHVSNVSLTAGPQLQVLTGGVRIHSFWYEPVVS